MTESDDEIEVVRVVHDPEVVEVAEAWLDEALRSGFTHMDEVGLHWLWVDDIPEVAGWPSYLDVCHYFDVLSIPIAGSHGIRRYEGSDRVAETREVIIPWEYLGRRAART